MKIMVVGGGGREHAIIKKIKENKQVKKIFALPGNGTIENIAVSIPIEGTELEKIVNFAKENEIDFAVVSPDNPLCMGLVDLLEEAGVPSFGPNKVAAEIEGSKVFAKKLMKKYQIPTADYQTFTDIAAAKAFILSHNRYPIVIKADGLAYGKGVIICQNQKEGENAIQQIMGDRVFGDSGTEIVIEEFLEGPEISVLCFTDGKSLIPMLSSMDYKKAYNQNKGPNTGGMGAISPNPYYTKEIAKQCVEEIYLPTIEAMNQEGRIFKGCLYFGLMLTASGPKVIEYNCRFGDPETQCVLPLLKSDLLDIMIAVRNQNLSKTVVSFEENQASCCISLCSEGYPVHYEKGKKITLKDVEEEGLFYFDCGSKRLESKGIETNSGRVFSVVAIEESLEKAIKKAYKGIENITFDGMSYRLDIGEY